jgi:NAD(P)-dependent dehydrogenase (short-subunit alcohol dehydrogenase family)
MAHSQNVRMLPLDQQIALVTGSCIGLGAAIATRLARDGARVIITGSQVERGQALAASLGGGSFFLAGDLRDAEATRALAATTVERCGGIDILVNNAAVSIRATIEEFTPEQFDTIMHVNLRSVLLLSQAALPSLKARRGVIVNIGSVNAHVGWQNLVVYAASKAAIAAASKNMANALKYARVRVHCLNPGWVDTEGERASMTTLGHGDDFLDREGARLPIGRLLAPAEVADAVAYFVSPQAAAFSGTVIDLEQYPVNALAHPSNTEPMQ